MQLLSIKIKIMRWLSVVMLMAIAFGIAININSGKVLAANEGCGSPAACEKQASTTQSATEGDINTRDNVTCNSFSPAGKDPSQASSEENVEIGVGTYGFSLICDQAASQGKGGVILGLIVGISNWLVGLVGAVVVLMIIVGGVQMVASAGSPEALKAAKGRITNAILSLLALISMRALLALVSIGTNGTSFFGGTFDAATYDSLGAVPALIANMTNFALYLGGALSVVFIIVGALRYIASGGNQTNLQKAKNTIVYAVLGLLISISALAIVNFIINNLK